MNYLALINTRFRHENAIVYVALNNPELEASQLALEAFSFTDTSSVAMGDGREVNNPAVPQQSKFQLNHEGTGKRRSIWDPIKDSELDKDIVEDEYTYRGCRKVGLMVFAIFIILPEGMQMTIMDTLIPTLVGSIVYGNVQLYSAKKQAWMLPAVDLGGILFLVFVVWLYFKNRARKRAKAEALAEAQRRAEEDNARLNEGGLQLLVLGGKQAVLGDGEAGQGAFDMGTIEDDMKEQKSKALTEEELKAKELAEENARIAEQKKKRIADEKERARKFLLKAKQDESRKKKMEELRRRKEEGKREEDGLGGGPLEVNEQGLLTIKKKEKPKRENSEVASARNPLHVNERGLLSVKKSDDDDDSSQPNMAKAVRDFKLSRESQIENDEVRSKGKAPSRPSLVVPPLGVKGAEDTIKTHPIVSEVGVEEDEVRHVQGA